MAYDMEHGMAQRGAPECAINLAVDYTNLGKTFLQSGKTSYSLFVGTTRQGAKKGE